MPVLNIPGPYPTYQRVMDLARSFVNDTFMGATGTPGEGQIFTNSAAMTIPFLRSVTQELYQELGNTGAGVVIRDNYVLLGITPVHGANGLAATDPATQVSISYTGYFDGTNVNGNLTLPADLVVPIKVWERTNGSNNEFSELKQAQDGLPSIQQTTSQGFWQWAGDVLSLPGSLITEDLRLRYAAALPLLDVGVADLSEVSVPIADCETALAWKLARNYGFPRGSDQIDGADKMATKFTRLLQNRFIRAAQEIDYRAGAYGENRSNFWPLDFHA